ncbi:MAG: fumarylacetoacetate hydrolase family protein [Steroidobacteraceae bacterium]
MVTYRLGEREARLGVLHRDLVVDASRLARQQQCELPAGMLEFIDLGQQGTLLLQALLQDSGPRELAGASTFAGNVTLLAPIPRPRKNIFGIGLNYAKHVEESARSLDTAAQRPDKPVIFSKPPTSVVSWCDPIIHNRAVTEQLDWETELAVIIGRRASRIDRSAAMDFVFGYSVINDISARDCRRSGQWIVSKGQDSFAPMGPCIVTSDEIPDPHDLRLYTKVNGVVKQDSNTRHMLFRIDELIADISSVMTLEPGDIIATGTPDGVGAGRTPPEFMWPGDVLESAVEPIGTLRNPIVAA